MEDIRLVIRERYDHMSKGDKQLSDFILEDPSQILNMTAAEIAEASGVSPASVVRYVKKLGADGLAGFKLQLATLSDRENNNSWKMADPVLTEGDSLEDICQKMQVKTENAHADFFYQLQMEPLNQAVELVRKARKIYVIGLGASYTVAYDLFHKLRRAGFDANCYQDLNMVTEFFNYLNRQDVVIAVSYSGRSKEILYACEKAKMQHAKIVAITRNAESPLRGMADVSLLVPGQEQERRIAAFESLQSSLMMSWLIFLGAIRKDFKKIEVELVKTRKLVEGMKEK